MTAFHQTYSVTKTHKKCYTFDDETYYKAKSMKRNFYIKVSDYENLSVSQAAIVIYEYTLQGLQQIKSFIRLMESHDILFIAGPRISTQFKMYDLEKA